MFFKFVHDGRCIVAIEAVIDEARGRVEVPASIEEEYQHPCGNDPTEKRGRERQRRQERDEDTRDRSGCDQSAPAVDVQPDSSETTRTARSERIAP